MLDLICVANRLNLCFRRNKKIDLDAWAREVHSSIKLIQFGTFGMQIRKIPKSTLLATQIHYHHLYVAFIIPFKRIFIYDFYLGVNYP